MYTHTHKHTPHIHTRLYVIYVHRNFEVECLRTSTRLHAITFQQLVLSNAITCNSYNTVP
jgi:hypothetical protein